MPRLRSSGRGTSHIYIIVFTLLMGENPSLTNHNFPHLDEYQRQNHHHETRTHPTRRGYPLPGDGSRTGLPSRDDSPLEDVNHPKSGFKAWTYGVVGDERMPLADHLMLDLVDARKELKKYLWAVIEEQNECFEKSGTTLPADVHLASSMLASAPVSCTTGLVVHSLSHESFEES
jgi:hypothetical protein